MFNLLIDTCVWLDLAETQRHEPMLDVIEELMDERQIALLVPDIVMSEFRANRSRVAERSVKGLSTHFNRVKEAVRQAPAGAAKDQVLGYLADLDHRIPIVGGLANGALDRIEGLLARGTAIKSSNAAKLRAADRGLLRKSPFHHEGKNGMADAILIEVYFEAVNASKARERFAFVTHNKLDFSLAGGNQKLPHADIAHGFSKIKSMYFITLADCIRKVEPLYLNPEVMKSMGYDFEPRPLSEMLDAMDELVTQVWFNRHKNLAWEIKNKQVKVVSHEQWEKAGANNSTHIVDSIWEGAKRAAADARKQLGKEKCGPHTDFEWGMINGKLSAIRWMLGDEWDMLDT